MSSSAVTSNDGNWQEFIALTGITSHLPKHFQHGLITSELILTCLASFEDHVIIGTNAGLVYLSHLPTLQTVRLKCENTLTRMCCLSAVRSLDDLVAAGGADGCITVFLLPRLLHRSSGPAPRAGVGQDLKRFSVSSLHSAPITSMSWSVNGLRLVSGDAAGGVGLLELDYDQCQCVGRRLLTEPAPVVQLDYWKQAVAVSTEERCLVYSVATGEVTAVGTKARKARGRYGAAWQRAGTGVQPDTTELRDWRGQTNQSASIIDQSELGANSPDDSQLCDHSGDHLQNSEIDVRSNITMDQPELSEAGAKHNSDSGGTTSADAQQPRTVPGPASSSILYTSRPGQRVWQADSSGSVQATMLIKDIGRARRIHVLDEDRPDKAEDSPIAFKFELLYTLESGHFIMYSSDSLVIFNPSTLCVESYIYVENFIRDISVNGDYIFILSKNCNLYCLSSRPLNLGQRAISLNNNDAVLDSPSVSPTLKKLGSKLYEQSSSLLGSVAKLGGAIATRVSETTVVSSVVTGSVVTGYTTEQQQQYSRNLSGELNSVTKQRLVTDPYSLQTQRRHSQEGLHSAESSDASTNRLVQSLYEQLPGTPDPIKQVEKDSEVETPLVVRGKVRTNHKRKAGGITSSPVGSSSSSPCVPSSISVHPSPAPAQIDPISCRVPGILSTSSPHSSPPHTSSPRASPPPTSSPCPDEAPCHLPSGVSSALDCQSLSDHPEKDIVVEDESDQENKLSLRTLENERKLGFLLDIDCLKNSGSKEIKKSEHEDFESALDNHLNTNEHSDSRDITVNNPDNNFYSGREPAMGISENISRLSLENIAFNSDLTAANITPTHGTSATSLDSIFSDCANSLCYGPPSGSSVPSLQSFSSTQILPPADGSVAEGQLDVLSNDQDVFTLTFESAGVTEARIIVTNVDREFSAMDTSQVKKEVIDGQWEHLDLPSCLKALTASDDLLVFVDSERTLYIGEVQERPDRKCVWGRASLPFTPTSVAMSASSDTLWLIENNSVFIALRQHESTAAVSHDEPVRGHESLKRTDDVVNSTQFEDESDANRLNSNENWGNHVSSIKYVLNNKAAACNVLQVCGDDTTMFYIKEDYKVYWRTVTGACRETPLHNDGHRFVSLSCRQGLLWAVDSNGALFFRIGQCVSNPLGVGWGKMTRDRRRASIAPLKSGSGEESSSPETNSRHGSFCFVDNLSTDQETPMSYEEALRNTSESSTASAGQVHTSVSEGRRRKMSRKETPNTGDLIDVNANNAVGADGPDSKDVSSEASSAPSTASDHCSAAVCLGGGGVGWRVTEGGRVQFRPGVSAAIPQGANTSWWQVSGSHDTGCESRYCQLASTARLLCLAKKGSAAVSLHPVSCQGSVWSVVGGKRWSMVSAESLYGSHGALACLCPTGALMMVNPQTAAATPVPLPDNSPAVSVCQRPEVLWLLSSSGAVWVRGGLSATAMLGSHWQQLDLHQISDVHLCHLSLGTEVAWAVDTRGGVYMRQGSLDPPHPSACPQAWLQVDNVPLPAGAVITKVFAGPAPQLVWALDSHQRVMVRVAIFPELPIGVAWEYVPGIRALHLSISEDGSVYCVTVRGAIYRREGVNPPMNYVGTRWLRLPGSLARLSVSVDGRLWGLDDSGRLLHHRHLHSTRWRAAMEEEQEEEGSPHEQELDEEDSWEVV